METINGQLSIWDVEERKPWTRECYDKTCPDHEGDEKFICSSTFKCRKRLEYKTLNTYFLEQLGHRGLFTSIGGCTILCEETKAQAEELIQRWKELYGEDK